MPCYVNLVFQGGGVRGIAYAGLLARKPPDVQVNAVAGTSAGSIVAALLAIGKTPAEIKSVLENPSLRSLLEDAEVERMRRFQQVRRDLETIYKVSNDGTFKISGWKAFKFYRAHRHSLGKDIGEVWRNKGLHSSQRLRNFLKTIFGDKRFVKGGNNIVTQDLRIVASDVSRQKYEIYSLANTPNERIVDAVHASCSIPIFFQPFLRVDDHFVDGGMLSNFPSFLFAQDFYPTIGFRLTDFERPLQIDSTASYLRALVLTMTSAHDKERGEPPHFASYDIPTNVPSTKFALTDQDILDLYGSGETIGGLVRWKEHCSREKVHSYYDPKPHEVLKLGLGQAQLLFNEYSRYLVEELWQETVFSVYIEKDWSTRYVTRNTYTVTGAKQLILTRFKGTGSSPTETGPTSLAEFHIAGKELLADGTSRDLIRIPAYNGEKEKGFLLFFSPPISSGRPRTTLTELGIRQEFANTLGQGDEDNLAYSISQRADLHGFRLTVEVFVHASLPTLRFEGHSLEEGAVQEDRDSGETYRRYTSNPLNTEVRGPFSFELVLNVASHSG
ncbi:MAG: patatin-like phospholipase family protein [Candidatus Sulfotelmatobacter sp.]